MLVLVEIEEKGNVFVYMLRLQQEQFEGYVAAVCGTNWVGESIWISQLLTVWGREGECVQMLSSAKPTCRLPKPSIK